MDVQLIVALVALVVSFFALAITALQWLRQLYSTAYDVRHCTSRTMGRWAWFTRRRWILREFRIEVTFSTPSIRIHHGLELEDDMTKRHQDPYYHYQFYSAPNREKRKSTEPPRRPGDISKRWYLCNQDAAPEAKCSWLALLEDTTFTNLSVEINEKVSSFDFLPVGFTRPFATIDRTSFLTLMTLFGVRWEDGGKDGKLTGIGEFCEVSVINHPYYGSVFLYQNSRATGRNNERSGINGSNPTTNDTRCWRFYLESEEARLAMFNCFNLGFATIKTHDNDELRESLLELLSPEIIERVMAHDEKLNGWYPILSEAIPCWACESMPKMVDSVNLKFKSVFSAKFARCKLGNPQFVSTLLHIDHEDDQVNVNLAQWTQSYLKTFPELSSNGKVYDLLSFSARSKNFKIENNLDGLVSWSESLESLQGIRKLDSHLKVLIPDPDNYISSLADKKIEGDIDLPMEWDDAIALERTTRNLLGMFFVRQQFKNWSPSTTKAPRKQRSLKTRYARPTRLDLLETERYTTVVEKLRPLVKAAPPNNSLGLAKDVPLAEWIVANRLLRGALWMVHNGNAFDQGKKIPRCNLSSNCLEGNPTVYIT